jgi:hypothetical protein
LVLEFVVPVLDADGGVEFVLEVRVYLGGVLLAVVNEPLSYPNALRLELGRPLLFLPLLKLVLIFTPLLYYFLLLS